MSRKRVHFFVTIKTDDIAGDVTQRVIRFIKDYLKDHSEIRQYSLYNGFGFCNLLLKGQTDDFFTVAKLPNAIGKEHKEFNVSTETYLVHGPGHSSGNDAIGEATFSAFRGRKLFVLGIVPEVYEPEYESQRELVEHFLLNEVRDSEPTDDERDLLRNFISGYLKGDEAEMDQTLFRYFSQIERRLRQSYPRFATRLVGQINAEMYRAAGIEPGKKLLAIGDLLKICAVILKRSRLADANKELLSDWEEFANLRNKLAHGEAECMSNWQKYLRTLLKYSRRIQKLVHLVASDAETGE